MASIYVHRAPNEWSTLSRYVGRILNGKVTPCGKFIQIKFPVTKKGGRTIRRTERFEIELVQQGFLELVAESEGYGAVPD